MVVDDTALAGILAGPDSRNADHGTQDILSGLGFAPLGAETQLVDGVGFVGIALLGEIGRQEEDNAFAQSPERGRGFRIEID